MASRVIVLQGQPILNEDGAAGEAITPGHLVQGTTTILKHATAGADAARRFALEQDMLGKDIDEAYAVGDTVQVGAFKGGDAVNAIIASGQDIAADQYLESAGDGTLRAHASGTRIARAKEAVDNSAGPSTARLRVEIV